MQHTSRRYVVALGAAFFMNPALSADLEDSIWLLDDGERRVEAALRADGAAELTIDENPDDEELTACNGTWDAYGNGLDVVCPGSAGYSGIMEDDGSGRPVWTRQPDGETGPMRQEFMDRVFAELERLEEEFAQASAEQETQEETPAAEEQELEPWMMGEPQRASGTGGSVSFGSDGQLRYELEFEGDMIVFDPTTGAAMQVSSGMSKSEFKALAAENGVTLIELSEDEYQAGMGDVFIFENDVLTRVRN